MSPLEIQRTATEEEAQAAVEAIRRKNVSNKSRISPYARILENLMRVTSEGGKGLTLIFRGPSSGTEGFKAAKGIRGLANRKGSPVSVQEIDSDGESKLIVIPRVNP